MKIDKIWYSKVDSTFVVIQNEILYTLKTKREHADNTKRELDNGMINSNFFGLPFAYIKKIEFRSDNDRLHIEYAKDSEDEIIISDNDLRNNIFEYLANMDVVKKYARKKPTVIARIKKPLIALGVVAGIFAYVLAIVHEMNQGYEFTIKGNRPGIGGLVLMLAHLGLVKNMLIFSPLISLALYKIYKNYTDDSEIETIWL